MSCIHMGRYFIIRTVGQYLWFYETKYNGYINVGALEPQFAVAFLKAIGRPNLVPEEIVPKKIHCVEVEVGKIFKSKTRDEWT